MQVECLYSRIHHIFLISRAYLQEEKIQYNDEQTLHVIYEC